MTYSKLKREESQGAQKMMKKLSYIRGVSLAEYMDTGDLDEKFVANIFA